MIKNFSRKEISEFDLNDTGLFWSQILKNATSKINTWAIFWYATIFKHGGLCVNPYFSYSSNIGFDGSGVPCVTVKQRMVKKPLNHHGKFVGKPKIVEDLDTLSVMRKAYMPEKNVRYYIIKFLTIFVPKETLKRLLIDQDLFENAAIYCAM